MTPLEPFSSVARVSSRAYSLASGGRREHYRQPGRVPAVSSGSYRKRLVRDAFASGRANKTIQPLQRMPFDVAVIQPESELVDVSPKMFPAGVMVDPMNAA